MDGIRALDALLTNEDGFDTHLQSHPRPARIGIVLARGYLQQGLNGLP